MSISKTRIVHNPSRDDKRANVSMMHIERSHGGKCWSGEYATIAEIADAENINESYVGRVLRLTLLAPDTVEAIMGGRQPADVTLAVLMKPFAVEWAEQRRTNSSWKDASDSR